MTTTDELDRRLTALEERLDRIANVNSDLYASRERVETSLRRFDATIAELAERVELAGSSFAALYGVLAEHVTRHPGPTQ
jgi:predicted nuclease with TOPRIM domain